MKDPIAALSPSSSSFVLRPSMATNSIPTYVPGRTERGSWSQFMSILWKTFLPMNLSTLCLRINDLQKRRFMGAQRAL